MNVGHALPLTAEPTVHVFPPALVPVLRERVSTKPGCLSDVSDEVLVQLLTTIFWAGLETYESERHPIGVAFLGTSPFDFIIPDSAESATAPLYQWKVQRFRKPRPFAIRELVKLAVAGADRRIYSAVNILRDGSLVISGLAREGFNVDIDPFVKIIALRPGCLSIRSGRDLLLTYERGTIMTGGEGAVFSDGPVRHALETTARAADLDDDAIPDYVDTVRALVREMSSHERGGLLVISIDDYPPVTESAPYQMAQDSSVGSLLRLSRRLGHPKSLNAPREGAAADMAFGSLLRNAFLTEAERITEELGALTAIDGAVLLNRHLALVAFGVTLPLGRPKALLLAKDAEGYDTQQIDFGSRGTRHHAGATYAAEHPGSVVFVASEDGQVSCMLRDGSREETLVWQLAPAEVGRR
jgi:DisA bacterial checkpoint controller nucleotide-binding